MLIDKPANSLKTTVHNKIRDNDEIEQCLCIERMENGIEIDFLCASHMVWSKICANEISSFKPHLLNEIILLL